MNETILIIDDSETALLALRGLFERNKYKVLTCQYPKKALEILKETPPSCILVDYEMPELDGPAFCRIVKSDPTLRLMPIIVLTGTSQTEYLLNAIDAGADDFAEKSVDHRIILARVSAMIRKKELTEEVAKLRRIAGIRQIIATYNHEFNNPLTIALGNLAHLEVQVTDPSQMQRIKKVSESLQRMTDLVKRIREIRDYVEDSYADIDSYISLKKSS